MKWSSLMNLVDNFLEMHCGMMVNQWSNCDALGDVLFALKCKEQCVLPT